MKAELRYLPFLNPLLHHCWIQPASGVSVLATVGKGYDLVTKLGVPNVRELLLNTSPQGS